MNGVYCEPYATVRWNQEKRFEVRGKREEV
jgi:hypothetical protein